MNIKDLRDGMRRVDIEAEVIELGEERTINLRTGNQARVRNDIIQDTTGSIKISFWDDQIDRVKLNDKVRVTNGYTSSFRGDLQLNIGKYGQLKVVKQQPNLG